MKRNHTIYEYFGGYTKKQVDDMLSRLSEEEISLLKLRYGNDFNIPSNNRITNDEVKKDYNNLVSKMKRLLKNPNIILRPRKNKSKVLDPNIKDEYIKMVEFFKSSSFEEMLNFLTPKEAVIICLKLGFIDNKYYDTNTISEFLKIEKKEIIDTTEKFLLIYKSKIEKINNEVIDNLSNSLENGYQKIIK